ENQVVDEPVVRNDCEAQREGPEPRCNQDEPVHELGRAALRRSYVEDEERQRNREDAVADPFCPVGSISPTGFWSFLVRQQLRQAFEVMSQACAFVWPSFFDMCLDPSCERTVNGSVLALRVRREVGRHAELLPPLVRGDASELGFLDRPRGIAAEWQPQRRCLEAGDLHQCSGGARRIAWLLAVVLALKTRGRSDRGRVDRILGRDVRGGASEVRAE